MQVEPFKVICIDDTKIPKEVPNHLHVKENNVYTVEELVHLLSSNVIGFKLTELPLSEEVSFPYTFWNSSRFIPYSEEAMAELTSVKNEINEMIKPDKVYSA